MEPASVSVVIVSRHRPEALARCLTAVAQLDYPLAELVVVGCPQAMDTVRRRTDGAAIKTVPFDEANISAARNRGIAASAGEIVAFVDDDAVPEPTWLRHLVPALSEPGVVAATGPVLGRNGISLQWGAARVTATGDSQPIALPGTATQILTPTPEFAIKTEGTNMAFRRDVLAGIGGFDEGFRFFLDETDVNWRLARATHLTAWVPLAVVHHGFAASDRRGRDRTPRDLTQIAASKALFLRKHAPGSRFEAEIARFRHEQRSRLLRFMTDGRLSPDDVPRLMRGFDRGVAEGRDRAVAAEGHIAKAAEGLRPFALRPGARHVVIGGRSLARARLFSEARHAVDAGHTATVLCLSPSALYHHVRFDPRGFWVQTGGLWGRSDRIQPLFAWGGVKGRIARETDRMAGTRFLTPVRKQY